MHLMTLACDLDGTLSAHHTVEPTTWAQLRRAKAAGWRLILATGRALSSFSTDGPFADLFDAIVAEDGAVVYFPRRDIVTLPFGRLDEQLLRRLDALNIPLERGLAIVATRVPHDQGVLQVLRESAGGATIEYNRGAVMVLPAGATKGTGLSYALGELGLSAHNVVACGDAENDRSLFERAELSAAVANAMAELKERADLVLPEEAGAGVRGLIERLLQGKLPPHRPRLERQLVLGHQVDGEAMLLDPFTLLDGSLGIVGSSGSGKSWLAGLLAEELLKQGYQLLLIDPEGDYRALRAFPHTLLLGGEHGILPPVRDAIVLSEYAHVSLVIDLSLAAPELRQLYVTELLHELASLRAGSGRPHWILIDEVQTFCPREGGEATRLVLELMGRGGVGLVSYRPSEVAPAVLAATNHWLVTRVEWPEELAILAGMLQHSAGWQAISDQITSLPRGQAYLWTEPKLAPAGEPPRFVFHTGPRTVPHIRHLHKYLRATLPREKRFYFHDGGGAYLGQSAANLWEFQHLLSSVAAGSLRYHLERGDFAHWVREVLRDHELARRMERLSRRTLADAALRQALVAIVRERYAELDSLI